MSDSTEPGTKIRCLATACARLNCQPAAKWRNLLHAFRFESAQAHGAALLAVLRVPKGGTSRTRKPRIVWHTTKSMFGLGIGLPLFSRRLFLEVDMKLLAFAFVMSNRPALDFRSSFFPTSNWRRDRNRIPA